MSGFFFFCCRSIELSENSGENRTEKRIRKFFEKKFSDIDQLNSRIQSDHLLGGKKWKCDGCGKNFSCEKSLCRHKKTFSEEHWFPCEFCKMNFHRIENFIRHLKLKHSKVTMNAMKAGEIILRIFIYENENDKKSKTIFICTKCCKIFYQRENLQKHHVENCTEMVKPEEDPKNGNESGENFNDFKCFSCDKSFVSLEGYEYHKNKIHSNVELKKNKRNKKENDDDCDDFIFPIDNNNEFICQVCKKSFPVKNLFNEHLKEHEIPVKYGLHSCSICPRSFSSSDGLKYHLATHTGEKRYSCRECKKKFIKKTHLLEHEGTHSKIKYFKCLRCPRTFHTDSAFRKHNKNFPGPHSFPCEKCGKLFTKESMIEKHICVDLANVTVAPEVKELLNGGEVSVKEEEENMATTETNDETFGKTISAEEKKTFESGDNNNNSHTCYKCFKIFPNLNEVQIHQEEHIGKQNYKCRFCSDVNFKRADDFNSHIRYHLGNSPYVCLKCNRKFISPSTLSSHLKKYPDEHCFPCGKCEQSFTTLKKLQNHECIFMKNSNKFTCACKSLFNNWNEFAEHAGTRKPYRCCTCDQEHATLNSLARHVRKHTGIKQYSCEKCSKSFRIKNNYFLHLKIHKEEEEEESKKIHCQHCDYKNKSQKRMNFHLFR